MFVNLQIGLILPCRTGASVTGIPVVGVADTLLASPPILRLKESISQLICVTHKITKITAVTKARAKGRPMTRPPLRQWPSRQIYQHKNTSILGSFSQFYFSLFCLISKVSKVQQDSSKKNKRFRVPILNGIEVILRCNVTSFCLLRASNNLYQL